MAASSHVRISRTSHTYCLRESQSFYPFWPAREHVALILVRLVVSRFPMFPVASTPASATSMPLVKESGLSDFASLCGNREATIVFPRKMP